MFIRRKDYLRLRDAEKNFRKLRDSNECANAYARYQDSQAEWWKKGYYELEQNKDTEIFELKKRIIDLEFEMEDIKETAFKMQQDILDLQRDNYGI